MSAVLFNLALKKRQSTASVNAEVFGLSGLKLVLAYAEDMGVIAQNTAKVKHFLREETQFTVGLCFSIVKTSSRYTSLCNT